MANRTLSTVRTYVRELYVDTSANSAISSTILLDYINRAYFAVWLNSKPRPLGLSHTSVWSAITAGTKSITSTGNSQLHAILRAFRETSTGAVLTGPELEYCPVYEILELQQNQTTQAAPTRYSAERVARASTTDVGVWLVRLHPIPDATYYVSTWGVVHPARIVNDSDVFDLVPADEDIMAHLAASMAAISIRREEAMIKDLLSGVPEEMRATARVATHAGVPRLGTAEIPT